MTTNTSKRLRISTRRVRHLMVERDIKTLRELARLAGVGEATVYNVLAGSAFTSNTAEKLADALACNPIDLMETEGYPPHQQQVADPEIMFA